MKTLVTGSQGYIGTFLTNFLNENGVQVFGTDIGYYKDCNLTPVNDLVSTKSIDIRDICIDDVVGFDAIVHLAALSNDPVGELDEKLTYEINYQATINLAELAKKAGVKRFVFVSTQSIYGISNTEDELDEYSSVKNPQTAYAKTKWLAEQELKNLEGNDFAITYVRPSTVFGWSPRLRTDIVFNNLLLNGLKYGKIEVHSDGTPWRPIVHISDLSRFILKVLEAPTDKIAGKAFNVGVLNGNYTVKQIAEAAQSCLPTSTTITFNTENLVDPRSYKVSFNRAKEELGFSAETNLITGGSDLLNNIKSMTENIDILGKNTNRLTQLKHLIKLSILDKELRIAKEL
jgi:nucleoside-diphosphate-sugar epimerase